MTVISAMSPLIMLAAAENAAASAAPTTPTTTTRRTHNPYLRAPPSATVAAFAGSLSLSSCTAAPSPLLAASQQQQQPSPSPMTMQQPLFPAVVKVPQVPVATTTTAMPKAAHPMRPQPQQAFPLFQQQQQYAAAATMMAIPTSSSPATACTCAASHEMGYPQASSCSAIGMMASSHAPCASFMVAAPQQQHQLQPYVQQQQPSSSSAPVSVISHKDLSGSALRYVRFTALDTTSAAAPRRDRPSGPFQAPAMPPVINEALMASPDAATLVDVFVSQLPFDLPLQSLRALADAVVPGAPIRIAHAAPHQRRNGAYDGCCFVKMPEADAHRFIAALHKRVLFDVFGLWVADCQEGLEELTGYCAHMQAMRPEARRRVLCRPTPFSAVTAELAKRVYAF